MLRFRNLLETWYIEARSDGKWVKVFLKSILVGWGTPLALLSLISIPNGLLLLTIGQAGIWIAYDHNVSIMGKIGAVCFILFKPHVLFFSEGYATVLFINALKTIGFCLIGIFPIYFCLLPKEMWKIRTRLLLNLVGLSVVFSILPFFPIVFALGFPILVFYAFKVWRSNFKMQSSICFLLPSIFSLFGLQVSADKHNLRLWANPFVQMGNSTPKEYFEKMRFKKSAIQGANAGDVYTIQMVLREYDLLPEQRLKYLEILHRYPTQRTPEVEKEYHELSLKLGHLESPHGPER